MDNLYGFTFFDIAVIATCLASGVHGLSYGFVRGVLSLIAWVGAGLITLRFYPLLAQRAELDYFDPAGLDFPSWFIMGLAAVLIFIASLFVLGLIGGVIARSMRFANPGFFDRALGFCFGAGCGMAGLAVFYAVYVFLVPVEEHPEWLTQARTLPALEYILTMVMAGVRS